MSHIRASFILAATIALPANAEIYGEPSRKPQVPVKIETDTRTTVVERAAPQPIRSQRSPNAIAKREDTYWRLNSGHLVRQELIAWGERSGWKVMWYLQKDWTIPADTEFVGTFKEAAAAVIQGLADNGLVIRGQFYEGNRTLVISGAGPIITDTP